MGAGFGFVSVGGADLEALERGLGFLGRGELANDGVARGIRLARPPQGVERVAQPAQQTGALLPVSGGESLPKLRHLALSIDWGLRRGALRGWAGARRVGRL